MSNYMIEQYNKRPHFWRVQTRLRGVEKANWKDLNLRKWELQNALVTLECLSNFGVRLSPVIPKGFPPALDVMCINRYDNIGGGIFLGRHVELPVDVTGFLGWLHYPFSGGWIHDRWLGNSKWEETAYVLDLDDPDAERIIALNKRAVMRENGEVVAMVPTNTDESHAVDFHVNVIDFGTNDTPVDLSASAGLVDDFDKIESAGKELAEAAAHVVHHYDGVHRLSLALANWHKARADVGGRGEDGCWSI